ncbi:hypothetical protein [Glycomyces niveus]|uniref:Protein ImuA n=1 Tax=Glycomyces niveus TaxID=2820287 RepID=A0ABS3TZN5_9ACTN|nr:hypothetical protein [Glycomyces sp. NEAU-S30]MBO3731985.1 hypothetical protein [Glycomyces sp. NEAU-S30]
MATSVAAALAAELGLRTAAELRPAAEAKAGREARLAGGPLSAALRSAPEAEPRSAPESEAAPLPGAASGSIQPAKAILPVTPDISALLPHGGLATVTAIMASRRGATSLLWRLLAGPTRAGAWCALVGMPRVYPLAATAAGVDLGRVALVDPGPLVVEAAGTLAEGVAAVVVPSEGLTPTQVRRLAARARKSGTAIIWWETRPVVGADARLEVARARWKGLRPNAGRRWGAGRLDACELEVAAHWRSGGVHEARIWPYGGETEQAETSPENVIDLRRRSDRQAAEANRASKRADRAPRFETTARANRRAAEPGDATHHQAAPANRASRKAGNSPRGPIAADAERSTARATFRPGGPTDRTAEPNITPRSAGGPRRERVEDPGDATHHAPRGEVAARDALAAPEANSAAIRDVVNRRTAVETGGASQRRRGSVVPIRSGGGDRS